MTLKFITALIDLDEPTRSSTNKSVETYIDLFRELIVGVPSLKITVFISESYLPIFQKRINISTKEYIRRLKVIPVNLKDTWTYRQTEPYFSTGQLQLPISRTVDHDTKNFLITQNSKIEWIKRGMDTDRDLGESYTHYGWIDFGIVHVFRDKVESFRLLEELCTRPLIPTCLILPGCMDHILRECVLHQVIWRFCGGVVIGDRDSLYQFHHLFEYWYPCLLRQTKTLTWEVNLWAWIEYVSGKRFDWFLADHNDSIVNIPKRYFVN